MWISGTLQERSWQRRHRLAHAQRRAAEAVDGGKSEEALKILAAVLDQAPYSQQARALRQKALGERDAQRDATAREQQAAALREEGKTLLRERRWREAENRFQRAVGLVPISMCSTTFRCKTT